MSGKYLSLLHAIITNNSFLDLCIKLRCAICIACRTKPLLSSPHSFLSFKSKKTDLKYWGTFDGIKIFPFGGPALLDKWNYLTNKEIYWSVNARNTLKLFANARILLWTRGVATPRTLSTKSWKILFHPWFLCDGIKGICYHESNIIQMGSLHDYWHSILYLQF